MITWLDRPKLIQLAVGFSLTALLVLSAGFLQGGYRFENLCLMESIIVFAWLIWIMSNKRLCLPESPLYLPILVYLLACLLSSLTSLCPRSSLETLTKTTSSVLGALLLIQYLSQSEAKLKGLVFSLAVATSLVSAISFVGIISSFAAKSPFGSRLYVPLGNPNVLASYLLLNIPLLICSFSLLKLRLSKVLVGAAIGLSLFILLLTYSRGGFLGLLAALFTLALIQRGNIKIYACLSMLLIGGTVLFACLFWGRTGWGIFTDPERIFIWQSAWEIFGKHPLTGTGIGTFGHIFLEYRTPSWHLHSHNLFLQILAEMGLVRFLAFGWLLVTLFKEALANYQGLQGDKRIILSGLIASLVGFLVHHQIDYVLWIPLIELYFWLIIALVVVIGDKESTPCEGAAPCEGGGPFYLSIPLIKGFRIAVICFWLFCVLKPYQGYLVFNQAVKEANRGRWHLAVGQFKKAVWWDSHPLYHTHLSASYLKTGQNRLAMEEYRRAAQLDPYFAGCRASKRLVWMLYRRKSVDSLSRVDLKSWVACNASFRTPK